MFEILSILALAGLAAASPLAKTAGGSVQSEKRQCDFAEGCVAVIDSNTDEHYGYLGTTIYNGGFQLTDDISACLNVQTNCEGNGIGQMYATNGNSYYPYVAFSTGSCGGLNDISSGSANYLYLSQGTETAVGASASPIACYPASGGEVTSYFASGIWSLVESTNPLQPYPMLQATWINADGSVPGSTTLFWWPEQNTVGLTGDFSLLSTDYAQYAPISEVNLFLVG